MAARWPTLGATYRLQFNADFPVADATDLIPYLHRLGVTHVYASPLLQARTGSTHGYDVVDPTRISTALGGQEAFSELAAAIRAHGMGLLLDIVPNHMAASTENPWWASVLADGAASPHADWFDIDWQSQRPGQAGRVLLPILGRRYHRVLEDQELVLSRDEAGFYIRYYRERLPLNAAAQAQLQAELPAAVDAGERERFLAAYNGRRGEPRSFDRLDALLRSQPYRLAYWRTASSEINYRRFFDITDLVSLRIERPEVFGARHKFVLQLVAAGHIAGLRIDHVDGLQDPSGYLRRLAEALSAARDGDRVEAPGGDRAEAPGGSDSRDRPFVVVEKILLGREELPAGWPVAGTTGYDFLNLVNVLLVDPLGADDLDAIYAQVMGEQPEFSPLRYAQKRRALTELFAADLYALARQLAQLGEDDRYGCDLTLPELTRGLAAVTACLPVYRTYIRSFDVAPGDVGYIREALQAARERVPEAEGTLDFIARVLLLQFPPGLDAAAQQGWLDFVMRWQQLTGPVTAKGIEDTALYMYPRLLSLNEVGGNPGRTGMTLARFHSSCQFRQQHWPLTLNATSTHDTKRSEDVRARIGVLSEIPAEWQRRLTQWRHWNEPLHSTLAGQRVPDPAEELLFYQTLIGAWPLQVERVATFQERLKKYVVKAAREAKLNTSWVEPDPAHETALQEFVDRVFTAGTEHPFLADFQAFQARLAPFGAWNSLAQTVLKALAPGVPDIYQGTELWDFSLVDPDNRRPVDFALRARLLEELTTAAATDPLRLARDLLDTWPDGRIKLYVTWTVLQLRRADPELFAAGAYVPLSATGRGAEHICAFARHRPGHGSGHWVVAVVPRLTARLLWAEGDSPAPLGSPLGPVPAVAPVGPTVWQRDILELPGQAPQHWRNALTGETLTAATAPAGWALPLADVLGHFPVAILLGQG